MTSGPRIEKVLEEDVPYMLDENARLRAELEAAKRDIRFVLQGKTYCICDICSIRKGGNCACRCEDADWRGPCAENGGADA
ncbi:MAG: hypothetical protein PHS57_06225 [Alphaproteobacteria bacterium]|nr:hypothetical protein [Alphaproteobacteria bacterium]